MNFTYYPFGNAYYNTPDCKTNGYNKAKGMYCWIDQCNVAKPPADCFKSPLLCQHGDVECNGNIVMACAIKTNPSFQKYMPFINCFEGDHDASNSSASACAQLAGLDWSVIETCVSSAEGVDATVANAQATLSLGNGKLGVPWVLINGEQVEDTDTLLSAVCEAYNGVKPAACSGAKAGKLHTKMSNATRC